MTGTHLLPNSYECSRYRDLIQGVNLTRIGMWQPPLLLRDFNIHWAESYGD